MCADPQKCGQIWIWNFACKKSPKDAMKLHLCNSCMKLYSYEKLFSASHISAFKYSYARMKYVERPVLLNFRMTPAIPVFDSAALCLQSTEFLENASFTTSVTAEGAREALFAITCLVNRINFLFQVTAPQETIPFYWKSLLDNEKYTYSFSIKNKFSPIPLVLRHTGCLWVEKKVTAGILMKIYLGIKMYS